MRYCSGTPAAWESRRHIFNREHDKLQSELAKLSSNTHHRIAKYSSHIVDETDPWLIIEGISHLQKRIGALHDAGAKH